MKKFGLVFIMLLVFCFVGCSPVASDSDKGGQDVIGTPTETTPDVNPGESTEGPAAEGPVTEGPVTEGEKTTVVLYFANADGNLAPEQRQISKVSGIARKTMEELCLGPQAKGLTATIPTGTRLLDINVKGDLCTVDFSKEIAKNHPGGSSGEILTAYSIVNTLTQFPTIKRVNILIDGQQVETLAGHLDLSVSLERNSDILSN